jgi:hypothetical protein
MTDQVISPLRRRMIEDMAIRKFAPKTQHDYVQRVKDFAAFLGRSPDLAQSEDVRGFRLHLASSIPNNNSSATVARAEISSEPRQPRRLEKKKNIVPIPDSKGTRSWIANMLRALPTRPKAPSKKVPVSSAVTKTWKPKARLIRPRDPPTTPREM